MHQIVFQAKRCMKCEDGHALAFLVASLGVVMVLALGIYIVSEAAVTKIQTQNAADAAALAGAGMLADCLDLLVFSNWVRPLGVLPIPWAQGISIAVRNLTREVIRHGPDAANLRAVQVGLANGALIIPLHNPDLGVETGFFGVVTDTLRGRTGRRFVEVTAVQELQLPRWFRTVLGEQAPSGLALAPSALARGTVRGRGMVFAQYAGGLGRVE
ncbi:MAG: hypothetical protein GX341_09415 [Firmicutes bacterium]|jgi:hypothetical protein|nr:hypothetical protein [Bacillota bacterium]